MLCVRPAALHAGVQLGCVPGGGDKTDKRNAGAVYLRGRLGARQALRERDTVRYQVRRHRRIRVPTEPGKVVLPADGLQLDQSLFRAGLVQSAGVRLGGGGGGVGTLRVLYGLLGFGW